MLKAIHFLLHWQVWLPGSGNQVHVGRDLILGIGEKALLSQPLIDHLSRKEIKLLVNVRNPFMSNMFSDPWISNVFLGLSGSLVEEWSLFTNSLSTAGIYLGEDIDKLSWEGRDSFENISFKNIYLALVTTQNFQVYPIWIKIIWSWQIQLKINLFSWLTISRKLLTWDGLQKRGFKGPCLCIFCKNHAESIDHIFISCVFTKNLWFLLKDFLKLKRIWSGQNITDS
jgi:hypothetical protein